MILDENEIDQEFFKTLMLMHTCEETLQAQEELDDEILLEIELANLDLGESELDLNQISVLEKKAGPIITIMKRPTSDSRKSWKIDKLVVGARSIFSA